VAGALGAADVPVLPDGLDVGDGDVCRLGLTEVLGAGEVVDGLGEMLLGRADGDWLGAGLVPGVVVARELGRFSTTLPMVVPEPDLCQMSDSSGLPAIASTAVTALIATTNVASTAPAIASHRRRLRAGERDPAPPPGGRSRPAGLSSGPVTGCSAAVYPRLS
jgi:hypothetical protein